MNNLRDLLERKPELLLWLANIFIWYAVFALLFTR